jgi:hypothetical protein
MGNLIQAISQKPFQGIRKHLQDLSPNQLEQTILQKDEYSNTVLHILAERDKIDLVKLIIEYARKCDDRFLMRLLLAANVNGDTALHVAGSDVRVGAMEAFLAPLFALKDLKQLSEILLIKDAYNKSVLHMIAQSQALFLSFIKQARSAGMLPEMLALKDDAGRTIQDLAEYEGNPKAHAVDGKKDGISKLTIVTAFVEFVFFAASIVVPSKVRKIWMGVGLSAIGGGVVTAMLDDKMPASYSIPKTLFGIPRPHALGFTLAAGTIGSLLPTVTALAGASAVILKVVASTFVPAIPDSLSNNGRAKEIQDKVNEACKALPYGHSMLGWYNADKAIIGPAYQRVLTESAKHYLKIYGGYHSEGESIPQEVAFAACDERNYIKASFQEQNSDPTKAFIYVRQLNKYAGNPTCESLFSAKGGDVEELAYDALKSSTDELYGRKVTDIHKVIGTWESTKKDDNLKLIYPEYILQLLEHHNSTAIATDHGLPQVITERISKNICDFKASMQAYLPEIIADNWLEDAFNKPHCAGDVPNTTASQVAM